MKISEEEEKEEAKKKDKKEEDSSLSSKGKVQRNEDQNNLTSLFQVNGLCFHNLSFLYQKNII